jgi:two-component system response regulator YesN
MIYLLQEKLSNILLVKRKKEAFNRHSNRKNGVNREILFKFLIPYVVVLIIPLVLGFIYYSTTASIVDKDEEVANLAILKQCSLILDQRFDEINSIVNQIESNPYVYSFENYSAPFTYPNSYRINETKNNLYDVKSSNDFILNYFLLFNKSKLVLNNNIVYRYQDFYNLYFDYKSLNYSQWLKMISSDVTGNFTIGYQPVSSVELHASTQAGKTDYNVVTYMLPLLSSNMRNGYIMLLIDNKDIVQLLSQLNVSDGGCAYIEDKSGKVITGIASGNVDLHKVQKDIIGKYDLHDGVSSVRINNKNMIVNCIQSKTSGLQYVGVQSPGVALVKLHYVHFLIIMVFLFSLLFGILASVFLAKKSSKPIEEIMNGISGYKKSGEKIDVYSYIKNAINSLAKNNEMLKAEVAAQMPILRVSFLNRLFKGEFISENEIKKIMTNIKIDFEGDSFFVVIFKYILNITQQYEADYDEMNGFKIVVRKTVDLLLNEESLYYDVEEDKLSFLFCDRKSGQNSTDESSTKLVEDILEKLPVALRKKIIVSVGGVAYSLLDISKSYEQARMTLEFNSNQIKNGVLKYDPLAVRDEIYHLPQDIQYQLLKCVKAGDKGKTKQLLHELFTENFLQKNLPISMRKLFIYELFAIIIKFASQISMDDNEFQKIVVCLDKLDHLSELRQVQLITETYWQVCDYMNGQMENQMIGIINDIILYIKKDYVNADLSLAKVSDQFSINEAYLSHLFKQQTGKNFSVYIEELRMEQAMELLKNTDLSINEIAQKVGYYSSNTFCRAFKRVNGFNALSCRGSL